MSFLWTLIQFIYYTVILPILQSGLVLLVVGGVVFIMMGLIYVLVRFGIGGIFEMLNKGIPVLGRIITAILGTAIGLGLVAFYVMGFLFPLAMVIFHNICGKS